MSSQKRKYIRVGRLGSFIKDEIKNVRLENKCVVILHRNDKNTFQFWYKTRTEAERMYEKVVKFVGAE